MAATGPDLIVNMAARALSVEYLWILLNSSIVSEFYIVVDKAPRGENISTVEKCILWTNIFEFLEIYWDHKNVGGPGLYQFLNGQLNLIGQ